MATDGTTCQGSICYLSFQQKSRHETKFRKLSRDTATTGPTVEYIYTYQKITLCSKVQIKCIIQQTFG